MADKKLFTGKYAVANPTRLNGSTTLEHIGDCELSTAFSATKPAENGMLLTVNKKTKKVGLPTAPETDEVYLHVSVLKGYNNEAENQLAITPDSFLPRLFSLVKNDEFETNAVIYDTAAFADVAAIKAAIVAGVVYGVADASGYIRLTKTAPTTQTVVLEAVEVISLPNYEDGIAFVAKKVL